MPRKPHSDKLTDDINALLDYLPIFESTAFKFGELEGGLTSGEITTMPYFSLGKEASSFFHALYDNGWIDKEFDWPKWQDEAKDYVLHPEKLQQADVQTIRQLLTTHVRKDRFCDGHLDDMFKCGHLTAILKRLREIQKHNGITMRLLTVSGGTHYLMAEVESKNIPAPEDLMVILVDTKAKTRKKPTHSSSI